LYRFFSYLRHNTISLLDDPLWRFQISVGALILLTVLGTVMYVLLEGWSVVDSLYMTVITIATVGFGEVRELSDGGRVFTIILIFLGVGLATYAISNAVSLALGPLLWESIRERRINQRIQTMENHFIVCGYGRMGRQIRRDLEARGEQFVLVDTDSDIANELTAENIPHVVGDATRDEILLSAGIERARGLVSALSDDASNVMTVLTARELNPKLFVVARVVHAESESKLRRAGANRVINPYQIGGHRIALTLLRPAVHDFLDHIFHFGEGEDIDIGQITATQKSGLAGQTIETCDLRRTYNMNILAIQQPDGHLIITPDPQTPINLGASLVVIGSPKAIYSLERHNYDE